MPDNTIRNERTDGPEAQKTATIGDRIVDQKVVGKNRSAWISNRRVLAIIAASVILAVALALILWSGSNKTTSKSQSPEAGDLHEGEDSQHVDLTAEALQAADIQIVSAT